VLGSRIVETWVESVREPDCRNMGWEC